MQLTATHGLVLTLSVVQGDMRGAVNAAAMRADMMRLQLQQAQAASKADSKQVSGTAQGSKAASSSCCTLRQHAAALVVVRGTCACRACNKP